MAAGVVLRNSKQHILRLERRYITHGVELTHIPQWIVPRLSSVRVAGNLLFLECLGRILRVSSNTL